MNIRKPTAVGTLLFDSKFQPLSVTPPEHPSLDLPLFPSGCSSKYWSDAILLNFGYRTRNAVSTWCEIQFSSRCVRCCHYKVFLLCYSVGIPWFVHVWTLPLMYVLYDDWINFNYTFFSFICSSALGPTFARNIWYDSPLCYI